MFIQLPSGRSVAALAAMATTFFLAGCEPAQDFVPSSASGARSAAQASFVPGEVLVKFAEDATDEQRNKALERVKASIAEKIYTKMMEKAGKKEGLTLIRTSKDVTEAIAELQQAEGVEFAEPNYIYTHSAASNDLYYTNGSLWGMYGPTTSPTNQFGSQAAAAWAANHTGSSSIVIGVIDEGFMFNHEDLSSNSWINPGEIAGNGVDDDRNGYVDDIRGWDFAGNDNTVYDGTGDDHGTHVAGTIGAVGGNSKGVAGVNWSVKMISAKFLGRNGGTTANAIKAVDYFTNLKVNHRINVVATNNSWGGGGFSQGLADAISRANAAGILFIAAAGNGGQDGVGDNNDVTQNYPSNYNYPNVIAVAAISSSGALAGFSNYGAMTVDIGAPGVGVYSTLPGSGGKSSYGSYNGTSMATPHVTGAAALYASTHAGATADQIKSAILGAAVPTASLNGKCVTNGRLNVSNF